ncbi:gamma-glutamylcyclotransferase family protein [Neptuniibacter halophilus]|uniref:gamma-glutamylcyclotransferase family protein n=1 Tax=Neptuniibacter halophilus TaxID=651666 RepID=UPI002573EFD3|nr:gamma-glutamylcyclotransferase family protein [Neptuniibacter halophilus]
MYYFAYGSNMSRPRLLARIPDAQLQTVAILPQHQFRLHKKGADGSAKADAYLTSDPEDRVYGALYQIAEHEREILDQIEGAGHGYEAKAVEVITADGERVTAFVYVALQIDCGLEAFDWYLQHILHGAETLALPEGYLEFLCRFKTRADPDLGRSRWEKSLYPADLLSDIEGLFH